jgi:hypothetical protein
MGLHETKKLLHVKGNNYQNEGTIHRTVENPDYTKSSKS